MRTVLPRALLVLLVLGGAAPAPLAYRIDPAGSEVAAKGAFFGLASKTAGFPRMRGGIVLSRADPQRIDLDIELDASALTAPDPVTLKRLKSDKFFWVDRYPTVRFRGDRMTLSSSRSATIAGEITARGVTRPATLTVTFATPPGAADGGQALTLTGRTTIDRRAFGMTAYSLIVGRKVAITMRARMVPR